MCIRVRKYAKFGIDADADTHADAETETDGNTDTDTDTNADTDTDANTAIDCRYISRSGADDDKLSAFVLQTLYCCFTRRCYNSCQKTMYKYISYTFFNMNTNGWSTHRAYGFLARIICMQQTGGESRVDGGGGVGGTRS